MVSLVDTQTSSTGSYGSQTIQFPDVNPDGVKVLVEAATGSGPAQPVPTNVVASGLTFQRAAYRVYHKGLSTEKGGEGSIVFQGSGMSFGLLEINLSGMLNGVLGPATTSGGYTVLTAPFGSLLLEVGDTSAGIALVYNRIPEVYTVPAGYSIVATGTVLVSSSGRFAWWAIILRDQPVQEAGSYEAAVLDFAEYPHSIGNVVCYPFALTPSGPGGISFQIMHDGQLIPATPNLWSGGQLTPVGLNLPE